MSILTITRTIINGEISDASQITSMCTDVENFVNSTKLDDENIQTEGVGTTELGTLVTGNFAPESVSFEKLSAEVQSLCEPIGALMAYSSVTPPTGYLYCNGAQVSRTVYADLYAIMGVSFGSGDGSTTFNVPDLRGRFLRGKDGATARDLDAATRTAMNSGGNTGDNVGSVQSYTTKMPSSAFTLDSQGSHTHSISHLQNTVAGGTGAHFVGSNPPTVTTGFTSSSNGAHTHTITGGGDSETRPVNTNIAWMVKY